MSYSARRSVPMSNSRPYVVRSAVRAVRVAGPATGGAGLGGALGALGGTLACLLCLSAIALFGLLGCLIAVAVYTGQWLTAYKQANSIGGAGALQASSVVLLASLIYATGRRIQRN